MTVNVTVTMTVTVTVTVSFVTLNTDGFVLFIY
jgi:hypothetical protein